MAKFLDITGHKYGKLTVIKFLYRNIKDGYSYWECLCDCGKIKISCLKSLRNGGNKSCGCLYKETFSIKPSNKKHLSSKTVEYTTWRSMKERCYNPKHKSYKDYGGRGITICNKWLNSFENFFEDMGLRPSKNHSIDRKDNSLGYFKENCYWATKKEQSNNQRSNLLINYNNKTQTLMEWCKELDLYYNTIWQRIFKSKWSIEKCFTKTYKSGKIKQFKL